MSFTVIGRSAIISAHFPANIPEFHFLLTEFKEGFAVFDKNGDGKITADELGEVMKSIGQEKTPAQIEAMISKVDADGK